MPPSLTARALLLRGVLVVLAGVLVRVFSGTALESYADYKGPGSSLEFSTLAHIIDILDSILIPLGVGLVVGGFIVASLSGLPRRYDAEK